ncbi:tRNA cyclic N6-threonylcarbamoyladenosine(37) synthase TcdA [Agaribacterium haliotis]|uniref:tRNA cyclic N6-threonylcarbamoyladenosine(37) synthase TcdA n=1 Tax=Agaribacterium haliotis TaxID=2013869 RepID=UPI000BB572F7|nr:tRNA cyclic N6-threonylcarbamoyladenosine(37) synthase TcdA [Agaribacterium haliotis]
MSDDLYSMRFGGVSRLYGAEQQQQLATAHMAVIGLGGVGSWAAEALARSGVGALTLIELDDICLTNSNRQLHTLSDTIGQNKLDVIAARLKLINPDIQLHCVYDFLTPKNIEQLIVPELNVVLDAIDSVNVKSALLAYCSRQKKRLICVGSSGGKRDPGKICVGDLGQTEADPMLAKLRNQLYRHHGFKRSSSGRKFRVDAVFSKEAMVYAKPDGSVCANKKALVDGVKLDCAGGLGSSVMVTGSFGFVAAAKAIERYLEDCLKGK